MKTWLNQEIASAIREKVRPVKESMSPQLCYEVDLNSPQKAISLVVEEIQKWGKPVVACSIFRGSQWRMMIVSPDELFEIFTKEIETEELVGVFDFLVKGGIYLSFSPSDAQNFTHEMLYTGWGKYERDVEVVSKKLGSGKLFRGN